MNADERLGLVHLKIERAEKHFIELRATIDAFLATKPYRVIKQVNPQVIYEISNVAPVPPCIGAIIGDAVQNLRSALDHIQRQLMLVALGVEDSDRESQFPIRNKPSEYESLLRRIKKHGLLREDALDALLTVEAHKGGKGHPLWVLNRLNNIDKHRVILTAGGAFRSANLGAAVSRMMRDFLKAQEAERAAVGEAPWPYSASDIPDMDGFFRPADILCPLKVGDVLVSGDLEMDPDNDFRFDIALDEPEIAERQPVMEALPHFADAVRSVVDNLRPCLE